jgi:hypothetical protein
MLIEEQEEIIAMLERLRAKKRYVLLCLTVPGTFFFPEEEKLHPS